MSTVTADPEYQLLRGQTWEDYRRPCGAGAAGTPLPHHL